MNERQKETLVIRVTSVGFSILVLAIFKPLGLSSLGWMAYVHLIAIWILGIAVCYLTESILRYIVKMPASLDKGVEYIIHRNLWFQIINTPLVSLMTCSYLHFAVMGNGTADPLSWGGYLQALIIIAFSSFAIGLYWRFKFRSRYLAAELEEVRSLNEQLMESQARASGKEDKAESVTLSGSTSESVKVRISDLLYIEAVGNYVKVYQTAGNNVQLTMIRSTMGRVEEDLKDYPMIARCHRAFLVNLGQVERIESKPGGMQLSIRSCKESIPVSRSHISDIRTRIIK